MYKYPYGNAQQLNLDWLMEQWQTVKQSIDGSLQGEIDRVEAAITDLLAARDAAAASAAAAGNSATAAAQSAQAAAANAATASAQAAAAATARSNAAQAANNAQAYAANAQTQAAAAQNAAGAAAASASQAAASASDAHDDALAASGSATNAATSAAGALQNFQLSDAARQAAQAAAQDAEDVLESIPEDYSELSADVVEIKADVEAQFEQKTIADVAIASFNDGADNIPVKNLTVDIEPIQDLHGQANPYPAGGGKNLLVTTLENLKTVNISGTWSGNTYTRNDVAFAVQVDDGGNVTGIAVSGTLSSGTAVMDIGRGVTTLPSGTYIMSFGTVTKNICGKWCFKWNSSVTS